MISRVTGADRGRVLAWLAGRLDTTPQDLVWTYPYEIIAVHRAGDLIGAMLFIHWRGTSVEVLLAGEYGWFSRRVIRAMASFAFDVLGVNRLVGLIRSDRAHARATAERIGFEFEGMAREADEGADLAFYAMRKKNCRWINNHGQG